MAVPRRISIDILFLLSCLIVLGGGVTIGTCPEDEAAPFPTGMSTERHIHVLKPATVNDMPRASNLIDIGEEFGDGIIELINLL
jgi:hypothetical protein